MAGAEGAQHHSRVSPRTLAIASIGSGTAAYVVSQLWAPGTLIGAAVTPVIVALVSEVVRKPIEAVPAPRVALAPLYPGASEEPATAGGAADDPPPLPGPPPPRASSPPPQPEPSPIVPPPPGTEPVVHEYARADYRTYDRQRARIVVATAGLAFLIAVAFYVVADFTTGSPITGGGGSSSLFDPGGKHKSKSQPSTTPTTPTQTQPQPQTTTTPAQTTPQTEQPAPKTTPAPQTEPTPAPASPPPATTPPAQHEATPPAAPGAGSAPP